MERKWEYIEPDYESDEPLVITVTETEIMETYWPLWLHRMQALGRYSQISHENCIQDYVTTHWAVEVK